MKTFPSTVVIADDDEDDIFLLESAVKTFNPRVEIINVRNGLKLLLLLNKQMPDVIFLDINMPVKNGIECLKEIKQSKNALDARVVIYSTSANLDEIEECYESGANYYFIKPNQVSSLNTALSTILTNPEFIANTKTPRDKFVLDLNPEKKIIF